ESEVALANQPRAPARARSTPPPQDRRERVAVNHELVLRSQQSAHVERVALEHRVSVVYELAVEVHIGDRRDAVEAERDLFLCGGRLRGGEAGAKPPVLGVEVVL